jgi:glycosyltransferase involved in cell wall biosynthesis
MRKPHETDVSPERPLVTFALFAYNQEKYIKSAVEAALAQTYTPLEIIVSDDASSDQTFDICSEVVARYVGPHTVKLNRNPRNVGLASHVNRMLEMSRGELLVMAAGDDVSVPERTEVLVQHWLQAGRPSAVCSSVYILQGDLPAVASNASSVEDLQWTSLQQHASDKISLLSWLARFPLRGLTGCAAAWSKQVFAAFGPIFEPFRSFAQCIAVLACSLGTILHAANKISHAAFE